MARTDRRDITPALVRELLAAHLPTVRADAAVRDLGSGLDHRAYLVEGTGVDGPLVVRFDTGAAADRVAREADLLTLLAARGLPVPVPVPLCTVPEWGCLVHRALPGVGLLTLPAAERAALRRAVASTLGRLLAQLHAVPRTVVAHLVEVDDTVPEQWLGAASWDWEAVAARVPMRHHRAVEALLLAAPPPAPARSSVFSHNDLGIEHVLVDRATGAVTGVLDWSDAALTDPAVDFGLVLRDLGPDGLDSALAHYPPADGTGEELRSRAAFYARCKTLEDLAYGIETGRDAYRVAATAALGRLFPG